MRPRSASKTRWEVTLATRARNLADPVAALETVTLTFENGGWAALAHLAVGDIVPADNLAYLLKYDSTQGRFQGTLGSKKSSPGSNASLSSK